MSSSVDFPILVNGNNVIVNDPFQSRYVYNFNGTFNGEGWEIGLVKGSIYNSWPNISPQFDNQSFSYIWSDGTTNTINLPQGFYTVSDLNFAMQNAMLLNKHYLINDQGEPVYYLTLTENPVQYAISLVAYPVPTSLPSGWSLPSGASWSLPITATTPQLVISSGNNFKDIIGFNSGLFPATPQTTQYTTRSTATPVITPVGVVNLVCSGVGISQSSTPYSIFDFSNADAAGYGDIIPLQNPVPEYYSLGASSSSQIEFSLVDQNNRPVKVLDNSATAFQFKVRNVKRMKQVWLAPDGNRVQIAK